MNNKYWVSVVSALLIMAGIVLLLKLFPPLELGTVASTEDQKLYLLGIGNRGMSTIQLTDISLNNGETPEKTQLQICSALSGFTLTDEPSQEDTEGCGFREVRSGTIERGTSPTKIMEKQDEGDITFKDKIYGVTIRDDLVIKTVHIKYKYFGIPLSLNVNLE